MPKRIATREEAVAGLTRAFRAYGYEGATLSRLQEATGLKPSSLYNYFPDGKEAMAAAALAAVDALIAERLLPLADAPEAPIVRARALAAEIAALYDGGAEACLIDLLSVGDARAAVGPNVAHAARTLLRLFADLAEAAGATPAEAALRAEDALVSIEGALVVSRALGATAPFARVVESLPTRLCG